MDKDTIIRVLKENKVRHPEDLAQKIIDQCEQTAIIERMASETASKPTAPVINTGNAILIGSLALAARLVLSKKL